MNNLRNIPAPAKLNLFLHVTGQREDGYHVLETFFDLIDWCDYLHFDLRTDGALVLANPLPGVPAQIDLCVQAAALLAQHARSRERDVPGVTINVEKHLPIGGGIGGGSSDAAATLLALNRLWNLNFPRATLSRIGLALGADVPVFIQGLAAWGTGIGEKLEPSKNWKRLWYVVVAPDTQVPTSSIFSAPELTRDSKPLRISGSLLDELLAPKITHMATNVATGSSQQKAEAKLNVNSGKLLISSSVAERREKGEVDGTSAGITDLRTKLSTKLSSKHAAVALAKEAARRAIEAKIKADARADALRVGQVFSELRNDLQPVAMAKFPKVAAAIAALTRACSGYNTGQNKGKIVIAPRMSGSGACVFAGFIDEESALAVSARLADIVEAGTLIKVAPSLGSHPLREWSFSA